LGNGRTMVRHALDLLAHLLDVDRRTNQDREVLSRDWPVTLSVPLTPMESDALRFLSSLYPANPSEISRAALLPFLDPGSRPPRRRDDGLDGERTARVQMGLDEDEARVLETLSVTAGVGREAVVRWAIWDSLGPLLETGRP
jgi:hypothetical protein